MEQTTEQQPKNENALLVLTPVLERDLLPVDQTRETLLKIRDDAKALIVAGVDDLNGYSACIEMKKKFVKLRGAIEERREGAKREVLQFGRQLDAKAKELQGIVSEGETHLKDQIQIVDDEIKRKKEEKELRAKERLDNRVGLLIKLNFNFEVEPLKEMSDEEFDSLLAKAQKIYLEAEEKRLAEVARIEKLEKEHAEQQAKIAEQEAEAKRLRDELIKQQKDELAEKEAEIAEEKRKAAEVEKKAREEEAKRAAEAKAAEDAREAERVAKQKEIDDAAAAHAAELKRRDDEAAALAAEQKEKEALAEAARLAKEKAAAEARALAEKEAAKQIADKKMFDEIKADFPTLESCWIEIARLRKLLIETAPYIVSKKK